MTKENPITLAHTSGKPRRIGLLVAALLLVALHGASAQTIDSSWTVTVNGQTTQVNPNGTFKVPNVQSVDNTPPFDGLSDEYYRAIGTRTVAGATEYFYSEPFRVPQSEVAKIDLENLTFTTSPPPLPAALSIVASSSQVSVGDDAQLTVDAILSNGNTLDVTAGNWTTYRTSNAALATIDPNGLLTAHAPGTVFVTASNSGVAAIRAFSLTNPAPATTVGGFTMLAAGTPVGGACVAGVGTGLTGISNDSGLFNIPDVPTGSATIDLDVTATIGLETFLGSAESIVTTEGAFTDAGIIKLVAGPAVFAIGGSGGPGSDVEGVVLLDSPIEVRAWSFGLCHDSSVVDLVAATEGSAIETVFEGGPPEFLSIELFPDGVRFGAVISILTVAALPAGASHAVLDLSYELIGAAGSSTNLDFCESVSGQPVSIVVTVPDGPAGATTVLPMDQYSGSITIETP